VSGEGTTTRRHGPDSLFTAATAGDLPALTAALDDSPVLLNAHGPDGWTALHLAAHHGHRQLVEALLARGADLHARSRNAMENTPLHAAAAGRRAEIADLLLAHGADVRAAAAGWTPLHLAAGNGSVELAEVLIAAGADVEARGPDGQTPLAIAVERRHDRVADLLRRHGAGPPCQR
jgi:ankyrin repeat protein